MKAARAVRALYRQAKAPASRALSLSGGTSFAATRGSAADARPLAPTWRASNALQHAMGTRFMSTEEKKDDVKEAEEEEENEAEEGGKGKGKKTKQAPKPQVMAGETVVGESEAHDFKAETRQLLDIVANSLYQDKEVFVRELISNASDALEKARYLSLTQGGEQLADNLEVNIVLDAEDRIFMIQDNGVGMTGEELVNHLGTIAKSGSKEFMKGIKEGTAEGSSTDAAKNIIGRFGVGFYSAFMVAEEVKVFSRKRGDNQGHCWSMDTSQGSYRIAKADGVEPGTKIVIRLKSDCLEYADVRKVREVCMRFSTFVAFPLTVNGSQINDVKALWLEDSSAVTDEAHSALFKHLAGTWEDPHYTLMYKADAPIDIKSVFYIPRRNNETFGQPNAREIGVHLYSRRVLIQKHAKDLLPEYLRFVRGVVDSEDLPLSISRETMQDKKLLNKLKQVLTKRVIRWLIDEAKKNPEKYKSFYESFVMYLKEGVATDQANSKDILKLLRYPSSAQGDSTLISFQEYADRMKPEQEAVYYLVASDRKAALASPYYEAFKRAGVEVIFCYAMHDEIVMGNVDQIGDKPLKSIEVAEPPETKEDEETKDGESKEEGKDGAEGDEVKAKGGKKKLSAIESDELLAWMKLNLGDKVTAVDSTNRLVDSPAILADHDSAVTRRMLQMDEFKQLGIHHSSGHKLLINPSHPLIMELHNVRYSRPGTAKLVLEQLLDNAKISAGIVDHVQEMMPRLSSILKSALSDDSVPAPVEPATEPATEEAASEPDAKILYSKG